MDARALKRELQELARRRALELELERLGFSQADIQEEMERRKR